MIIYERIIHTIFCSYIYIVFYLNKQTKCNEIIILLILDLKNKTILDLKNKRITCNNQTN